MIADDWRYCCSTWQPGLSCECCGSWMSPHTLGTE
jgi:hypothetical protein